LYIRKLIKLYHSNKNFFYLNKIYKNVFNNNVNLNNNINNILDFDNNFDKKFNNYHLIMIYKKIIINYISYNYKNFEESINFLKIILQKKLNLYKTALDSIQKNKSSEGGDECLKYNQENLNVNNNLLFNINNLNYVLHIKYKSF